MSRTAFSDQLRKNIIRYKRFGNNLNLMGQSACLVFNPNMIYKYTFFFNCSPVGRAPYYTMVPT